jgi:RHS repeat-associated protein
MTRRIWADGRSIAYRYDAKGRPNLRIDSRGIRTYYEYDGNDNLINTYYSNGTPAVTYTYDDFNRLMRRDDATGTTQYSYYADGAVHTVDGPWDNDTLTYTYDRLGRMTGLTPQTGQAHVYTYDDLNRLTTIETGPRSFNYAYTGADPRVQSLTRPQTGQTEYSYADPLKRLTALINTNSSGQPVNRFDYAYNDTEHPDQRASETFSAGPDLNYSADQLTTYEYNALDQLIHAGTFDGFVYDEAGNLTGGYTPQGDAFEATYDAENRMTSIAYADEGGIVHRTEFVYRADNFLIQIRKYANSILTADTRIVRSGSLALQDRDGANQITREYTWGADMGGGIGGLLNMREGAIDYAYLYDGKGNVSAVLDTAQTVAAAYRYDSFGRLQTQTGSLVQPFQYSTKRYFADSGLLYFGYRYYAPALGKWITRDPIGESGGYNLYAYVLNDPISSMDPSGKIPLVGGAIIGGIAGGYGGFLSGIQSGNLTTGILGGVAGAAAGAIVGALLPQASSAVGGMIGGAISGAFGGALGGGLGEALSDPCASAGDIGLAAAKGGGIGALTGALGGGLSGAAEAVGLGAPTAVGAAGELISAPIGWGLGIIEY